MNPEQQARREIDRVPAAAGRAVQDLARADIHAARGVAIREFPLTAGHGVADYMLHIDGRAAGVIEAKQRGATLTGVEQQSGRYAQGLPASLPTWARPLLLLYESTGAETHFTNGLDPEEFGRGNEFAQKITYRSTGSKPEELIKAFRTSYYYPRIAVTDTRTT